MASSSSSLGLDASFDDRDKISITVKFSSNQSYTINTNNRHTIGDLKESVAKEAKVSARNINLVLAGQLLNDLAVLEDCGVGAHTVVHAFCWSDDGLGWDDMPVTTSAAGDQRSQSTSQLGMTGDTSGHDENGRVPNVNSAQNDDFNGSDVDGHAFAVARGRGIVGASGLRPRLCTKLVVQNDVSRFFVFCKLCECVRPAKLRLSCSECGSGAFLLDRGPSNWEDISSSTTIRGVCKANNCSCKMPAFNLRCSESHTAEVDGTAVVLKHIQANRRRVECIICVEVMSHVLIFPCSPGHVICLDCFRQYGSTCLSERRFVEHPQHGYTLPCPAGCNDSHIEESHHFLLLGPEKYERYKSFGAEEFVLQNGGMLCPAPGCGMGLVPDDDDRFIRCQECRFEFCRECRRAFHPGPCDEYLESLRLDHSDVTVCDERAERACWERQSLSLIEETTKACPGCQAKTERSGGCMHMICSRCYKEWCWICVKPWNRDCQADHWFG